MSRILTTHTGSLIRPPELRPFLWAVERGEAYDADEFHRILRDAVEDVVRKQAAAGIDVVNDGEFGKISWITYLYDRVSGIETRVAPFDERAVLDLVPESVDRSKYGEDAVYQEAWRFADFWTEDYAAGGEGTSWACTGPIVYDPTENDIQLAILREAVDEVDVTDAFVTAVSPASLYWIANEHYATEREFVFAVADALRQEYRAIVAAGFVLQVDDAVMWHKLATIKMQGGAYDDYRAWAELRVEAINHALEGIPPERVRYHICSSSGHGPHTVDPGVDEVLEFVLNVNAGAFLVEQANVRHEHEWMVWNDVPLPEGKVLVPGVVTHHTEVVEHPELVAQRLERISAVVGADRVMAGTDCGFAQAATTRRVPEWTQWAKLRALAEGAALASRAVAAG
jgi:5-methyltetrahydropteroyltriglutamate--homocysteine methyltransferase